MSKPLPPDLAASLREAIARDPRTPTAIALAAGVPQPSLSRWLSGKRNNLSLDNVSRLCRELGLSLQPQTPHTGE